MMHLREDVPVAADSNGVLWTGRSGRRYLMSRVPAHSTLAPGRLYVLAESGIVRWVGTAGDLIADQFSRARFRQLSAGGAEMLSMTAPEDELGQMTLAWDLEGTSRFSSRNAA